MTEEKTMIEIMERQISLTEKQMELTEEQVSLSDKAVELQKKQVEIIHEQNAIRELIEGHVEEQKHQQASMFGQKYRFDKKGKEYIKALE